MSSSNKQMPTLLFDPMDLVDEKLSKESTNASFEKGELTSETVEDQSIDADLSEDLEDEADLSYDEGLEDGFSLGSEIAEVKQDAVLTKREDTRSRLAIIYTIATFLIFAFGMCIAVLDGVLRDASIIDNLSTIIPLISGVFLGTLGFILGYYFRKGSEDE